jgi:hypothetical protein
MAKMGCFAHDDDERHILFLPFTIQRTVNLTLITAFIVLLLIRLSYYEKYTKRIGFKAIRNIFLLALSALCMLISSIGFEGSIIEIQSP